MNDLSVELSTCASSGPQRQRATGIGKLVMVTDKTSMKNRINDLYQQGSAKIRFPSSHGAATQVVLMNASGGMTGDDVLQWSIAAQQGASLAISTAAAEKLYASHGPAANVSVELQATGTSRIDWLPQETILFDQSVLRRRMRVNLNDGACALLVESLVLGRHAMQEQLLTGGLDDRWDVYRDGALTHLEALKWDSPAAFLDCQKSPFGELKASATVLWCSDETPEQMQRWISRLDQAGIVNGCHEPIVLGCSCMPGRMIIRLLATHAYPMRQWLMRIIRVLSIDQNVPAVWKT